MQAAPGTFVVNTKVYRKLRHIKRGGSARVDMVMGPDNQAYAIKFVNLAGLQEHVVACFRREIEVLRQLQGNDRVIQVIDFEDYGQELAMVLELAEADLSMRIEEWRSSSCWDSGQLSEAYIDNLRHTFVEMVLDPKPANFLVVNGRLKIADFGISLPLAPDGSTTSVEIQRAMGTNGYVSTDVVMAGKALKRNILEGLRIRRSADIFCLGAIMQNGVYGWNPPSGVKVSGPFQILAIGAVPVLAIEWVQRTMARCMDSNAATRATLQELLGDPFLHPSLMPKIPSSTPSERIHLQLIREVEAGAAQGETDLQGLIKERYRLLLHCPSSSNPVACSGVAADKATEGKPPGASNDDPDVSAGQSRDQAGTESAHALASDLQAEHSTSTAAAGSRSAASDTAELEPRATVLLPNLVLDPLPLACACQERTDCEAGRDGPASPVLPSPLRLSSHNIRTTEDRPSAAALNTPNSTNSPLAPADSFFSKDDPVVDFTALPDAAAGRGLTFSPDPSQRSRSSVKMASTVSRPGSGRAVVPATLGSSAGHAAAGMESVPPTPRRAAALDFTATGEGHNTCSLVCIASPTAEMGLQRENSTRCTGDGCPSTAELLSSACEDPAAADSTPLWQQAASPQLGQHEAGACRLGSGWGGQSPAFDSRAESVAADSNEEGQEEVLEPTLDLSKQLAELEPTLNLSKLLPAEGQQAQCGMGDSTTCSHVLLGSPDSSGIAAWQVRPAPMPADAASAAAGSAASGVALQPQPEAGQPAPSEQHITPGSAAHWGLPPPTGQSSDVVVGSETAAVSVWADGQPSTCSLANIGSPLSQTAMLRFHSPPANIPDGTPGSQPLPVLQAGSAHTATLLDTAGDQHTPTASTGSYGLMTWSPMTFGAELLAASQQSDFSCNS